MASFKRKAAGDLLTFLIGADDASFDREPLLARAAAWFRAGVSARKPRCFGCRAAFADGAEVGAFLFGMPRNGGAGSASVAALSDECWRDLSDDEIERAALRVLRKVMPGARFRSKTIHQDAAPCPAIWPAQSGPPQCCGLPTASRGRLPTPRCRLDCCARPLSA